jgi:hypothetical protein
VSESGTDCGKALLLALEAIRRQAEQMRADLSSPAPTALAALLVQRVVVCWLEMNEDGGCGARATVGRGTWNIEQLSK